MEVLLSRSIHRLLKAAHGDPYLLVLGIKPRVLDVLNINSTTEPHPHSVHFFEGLGRWFSLPCKYKDWSLVSRNLHKCLVGIVAYL